jgi:hypothetical protein
LAVAGGVAGYRWIAAIPAARAFAAPERTRWAATGTRQLETFDSAVLPEPDTFHAMHVDTRNSDEIWSVAAPVVQFEWNVEPEFFVAEGPTFENEGNLYFAPVNAREDVSLVSHDRRAAVPAAVIRGDILDPAGVEIAASLRGDELDAEILQRLCGQLESLGAERDRATTTSR